MSLEEQTKQAKICASEYDKTRKTLLRLYPWGFAKKRVVLTPEITTPVFGFEYQFQLPSDYLRVVELFEYDGEYQVEDGRLLANTDILNLRYIYNVEDLSRVDSLFIDAFQWFLGYRIARYLSDSETVRQEAWVGFRNVMPMAKFVQSTENSQRQMESYDLIEARFGSGFVRDPKTH